MRLHPPSARQLLGATPQLVLRGEMGRRSRNLPAIFPTHKVGRRFLAEKELGGSGERLRGMVRCRAGPPPEHGGAAVYRKSCLAISAEAEVVK